MADNAIPASIEYQDLFGRYVDKADGKALVGDALAAIICASGARSVLDVGAGRGEIAARLLDVVDLVHAIEPRDEFCRVLRSLSARGLRITPTTVQEFDTHERYDIVLLSYVLESINPEEWPEVLQRLSSFLRPQGRILGVTYLDGCDWDCYAAAVESCTGMVRKGGASRIFQGIRRSAHNVRILEVLDTHIWDVSCEALYQTLRFFFRNGMDSYVESHLKLLPELTELTTEQDGRTVLEVTEVIFSIAPLPCQ